MSDLVGTCSDQEWKPPIWWPKETQREFTSPQVTDLSLLSEPSVPVDLQTWMIVHTIAYFYRPPHRERIAHETHRSEGQPGPIPRLTCTFGVEVNGLEPSASTLRT